MDGGEVHAQGHECLDAAGLVIIAAESERFYGGAEFSLQPCCLCCLP